LVRLAAKKTGLRPFSISAKGLAATRPDWQLARCAAILALNTTMRGCELKGLRWQDINLFSKILTIRRQSTKTDAGSRVIPLNRAAILTLSELRERSEKLGSAEPDHYSFPACECGKVDPTKPIRVGGQLGVLSF
jgi:integrase